MKQNRLEVSLELLNAFSIKRDNNSMIHISATSDSLVKSVSVSPLFCTEENTSKAS